MQRTRAVLLSVLLVVSTVGGPVALSGSVLATQSATIDVSPPESGATAAHNVTATVDANEGGSSLNGLKVEYGAGTPETDVSNVGVSDVNALYINESGGDRTDVTDDLQDVTVSNNGATVKFGFGGAHSISLDDTIVANFSDVQNPDLGGTYDAKVYINPQSTSNPVTTSFDIDDVRNATINATPDTEAANATHTLLTRPKQAYNNTTLTNVTVDYGAVSALSDVANLTAFVDENGNREYDQSERNLTDDVSGYTVAENATELRVNFSGAGTVNASDDVVLMYDNVTNPNDGSYGVDVFLNGDTSAHGMATLDIAAVTGTTDVTVAPRIEAPNETTQYTAYGRINANDASDSLNSIEVDFSVGASSTDVSNVGQGDIVRVGIERTGDADGRNFSTLDINATYDLSSASASNNGHTLTIGFGGNEQLQDGDYVFVQFEDAQNPSSVGEYQAGLGVNVQSTDNPGNDTYNISTIEPRAAMNVTDRTDSTVTTHEVTYTPGSAINGTNVSNLTVTYPAGETDLAGVNESNVTASLGGTSNPIGVQGVAVNGSSLTVNFTGNHTVGYTKRVIVTYTNVTNPTTAGTYRVTAYPDGNTTASASASFDVESDAVPYDAHVRATNDTPGATTTHAGNVSVNANDASDSLNSIEVDYQGTGADVGNVTQSSVRYISIDGNADGDYNDGVDTRNATDDLSGAKLSNDGKTVQMTFGGDYTLPNDAVVAFAFADVRNPDTTGNYTVDVDLNVQSTENAASGTLTIDARDSGSSDDSGSDDSGSGGAVFFPPPQDSAPETTTKTTTTTTTTETTTEAVTATTTETTATEATTETATETTTTTTTETPERTTETTTNETATPNQSGGTSGFTAAAAVIVALLSVALLVFRVR